MVRKISHSQVLRRGYLELTRPGMGLLAFVSSLALAPACTLVVGERPREEDAGADQPLEHDAAMEQEAGFDAGMGEDSGTALDATSPSDASDADAAPPADAAAETGAPSMEAGGADSAIVDAGPAPDCGSSAGMLWYPDGDDDGYGRSAEAVQTCGKPASGVWVRLGGDCKDNDGDVRPNQTSYFGTPYRGANGNDSYDYDCSGSEEGNPSQQILSSGCDGILDLLNCQGNGYLQQPGTSARANAFCGSTKVGTCMAVTLGCTTAMDTAPQPYTCR